MKTMANKLNLKPRWTPRAKEWQLDKMKVGGEKIITTAIPYCRTLVSNKFRQWGWGYSTWTIEHEGKPALLIKRTR